MVKAVRGAVQVEDNTLQSIEKWIPLLILQLVRENSVSESDLISIIFSQTADLTAGNPAAALRKTGFQTVPLFCTLEPDYPESLPTTVRVLLTFNSKNECTPVPVYLNGAESLRKDLFEE